MVLWLVPWWLAPPGHFTESGTARLLAAVKQANSGTSRNQMSKEGKELIITKSRTSFFSHLCAAVLSGLKGFGPVTAQAAPSNFVVSPAAFRCSHDNAKEERAGTLWSLECIRSRTFNRISLLLLGQPMYPGISR